MRLLIVLVPFSLLLSGSSFAADCPSVKSLADALHETANSMHASPQVSDDEKAKLRQLVDMISAIADDYDDNGLRQGVKQMTEAPDQAGFVVGLDTVVKELDEAYADHCGSGKAGH